MAKTEYLTEATRQSSTHEVARSEEERKTAQICNELTQEESVCNELTSELAVTAEQVKAIVAREEANREQAVERERMLCAATNAALAARSCAWAGIFFISPIFFYEPSFFLLFPKYFFIIFIQDTLRRILQNVQAQVRHRHWRLRMLMLRICRQRS